MHSHVSTYFATPTIKLYTAIRIISTQYYAFFCFLVRSYFIFHIFYTKKEECLYIPLLITLAYIFDLLPYKLNMQLFFTNSPLLSRLTILLQITSLYIRYFLKSSLSLPISLKHLRPILIIRLCNHSCRRFFMWLIH